MSEQSDLFADPPALPRNLLVEAWAALDAGMPLAQLPDELLFALAPERDVAAVIELMIARARGWTDDEAITLGMAG